MLNREVFHTDPEKYSIANQGVAKILFPPESGLVTETLRGELQTFITDGEYGRGLMRILESFLAALGRGDQGAVWISGFYGSGKSHLAKMLGALWTDFEFPDGARASGLVSEMSEDLRAALRSLRAAAARAGGLHCAGGGPRRWFEQPDTHNTSGRPAFRRPTRRFPGRASRLLARG